MAGFASIIRIEYDEHISEYQINIINLYADYMFQ